MPTSRFDININQPYQSVRIPLPLDYLAGIAKNMQDDYDKGLHATDPFSKIASVIEAAPMYADEKKKYIDSFNKEREDLYNSTKSYSDPNFQRKANELVTKYANDPRLDQFKATSQAFKDYQTQKKDAKNARNLDFTYELQPDGSYKQITLNQGVYSPKFTEYEDYNKTAKEVMGKIAESGYNRENDFDFSKVITANNGETQVYSRTKGGWVGVSDPQVQNLSKLMVEEYGNTNAGKHHLQSLLKPALGNAAYNLDYKGLADAAQLGDTTALQYKQAIDQEFANHLYASNANQIGGKSTESIDYMNMTDRKKSRENDESNFGKIRTTNEQGNPEATDISSVLEGLGLHKILDANGEWITDSPIKSKYTVTKIDGTKKEFDNSSDAHKFAGNTGAIEQTRIGSNKSADEIVNEGYKVLVQKSKDLGLPTPIDGKYKDQLYNYALQIAKQRSTTSNLQPNTSKNLTAYFLGENSNIHNMEVYPQGDQSSNAKATNEEVATMAKNSKITGIDYYGDNQAGWKIAVTPKDEKGNPIAVDRALIGVPRDKVFEEETRPVWQISKGALQFAKTGKVSDQYKDQNYNSVQDYSNKFIAGKPKIAASSTEYDSEGNQIIRGSFTQYINGKPQLFAIEFNPNYVTPIIKSLDEVQNDKTTELQIKGSLNQYVNKLAETTKPSKVQ